MELIKEVDDYKIFKKRKVNRYAVRDVNGNYVNGKRKEEILKAEGLIGIKNEIKH